MIREINLGTVTLLALLLTLSAWPDQAVGVQIQLKDGRILSGDYGETPGVAESPIAARASSRPVQKIPFLNDDLRFTFFSKRQFRSKLPDDGNDIIERFRIRQNEGVTKSGTAVYSMGRILGVTPMNEFGRRTFSMQSPRGGRIDVIQAVTEITPTWTKIESFTHVWDMRVATTSIPVPTLEAILAKQVNMDDVEDRKKIARFYLQAKRYGDASRILSGILTDFENLPDIKQQLTPAIRALEQQRAQQALDELELRRDAGQHGFVQNLLEIFPSEGVAGETLQVVRERTEEYDRMITGQTEFLANLTAIIQRVEDEHARKELTEFHTEIEADLGFNTIARVTAFRQMADDEGLTPDQRAALAVSGWLLGSDQASTRLPVALSLIRVRSLIEQYLNAPDVLARRQIFERFVSEEAATPELVAGLLAHMKPPRETPEPNTGVQGFHVLEATGPGGAPLPYLVQLPPEYDPLRHYPTIVTLNGAGTTPEMQIDWWAREVEDGQRRGQAMRHGYIVVAPAWSEQYQQSYRYSGEEHASVLFSLRDACRRFSIDTDRVFLTGHSMGGDAAWDIGLAHPDLWAGVIPIVARADRYCSHYWENARLVPYYFVFGELDGDRLKQNAMDLDRYLKGGFNATVVSYQGRGHESFTDEIHHLFDWMNRMRRDFFPREFEARSMRPWDSFFWWVEVRDMPPKTVIRPEDWPPPRNTRAAEITASIKGKNLVNVKAGSARVTLFLSPELLNFDERVTITINTRKIRLKTPFLEGDLETILEDARARVDRQHPFWVKIEG